jgi:Rad3-related DNA helicase
MFRTQEQSNFSAIVAKHMADPDAPLLLEGATGLGKTRAYLKAVMDAARNGKRIAIALPSHQLIDQLLSSNDLAAVQNQEVQVLAFRPAKYFDSRSEFNTQKQSAMDASVMLCTSASVIIDQRLNGLYNGAVGRDYIIFDEADQLPDAAALQSDCEITQHQLKELDIKIETAEQAAKDVLRKKEIEPEVKAAALMLLEAIDEPAWYYKAGITDEGEVKLFHKMPGRLLKKVANRPTVAFISATLSIADKFDDFKRAMGIQEESMLSTILEPANHGDLKFHVSEEQVNTPEWSELIQTTISKAKAPILLVTPSHELAEVLGAVTPSSTVRIAGETASQAASRMGSNRVLIVAGAWAGLDTPIQWASIVVPRIPYDRPVVLDGHHESSFLDTRNKALRRMRQVIGRGLRSPDAQCEIYILDGRYKNIEAFVPKRFRPEWTGKEFLEGGRREVVLSKIERDPSVRVKALKHFGHECMSCGFKPKVVSQLDVHHLFPLRDGGERLTGIEDLAVLCANCHRLAHSTNPPLTVEAMKLLIT